MVTDMENEIIIHDENDLRSKIYTIRGQQVMLDFDLAEIYGYSVKAFNQQVKNNIEKFDNDFMFQLNETEFSFLRSKFLTSKIETRGGRQYFPYAFTEQGVYMLMTVLPTLKRAFRSQSSATTKEVCRLSSRNLTIFRQNIPTQKSNLSPLPAEFTTDISPLISEQKTKNSITAVQAPKMPGEKSQQSRKSKESRIIGRH